jgi:hypothetical protein
VVKYEFTMNDGTTCEFEVDVNRTYTPERVPEDAAPWTRLTYHQCANCPLNRDEHPHCPAALDLQAIARQFSGIVSSDRIDVTVWAGGREYRKRCAVQEALNALFGVVLASCGCPHFAPLRSMARRHLPFASYHETLVRSAGTYLLRQYLISQRGGTPDWKMDGLKELYDQLGTVDCNLAERLRAASQKDANLNALIALNSLSFLVGSALDQALAELVESYFPELADTPPDGAAAPAAG